MAFRQAQVIARIRDARPSNSLDVPACRRHFARMLPEDRLIQITQRFEFLEAKLNAGPAPDEIAAISREYADLRPVVAEIAEWSAARDGLAEAQLMLSDPDMRELAEDEIQRLKAALPDLEQALRIALLPKDAADARPAERPHRRRGGRRRDDADRSGAL